MTWMTPGTIESRYGQANPLPKNLIQEEHRVRPTSGLEFISSRHFPDEVQGDIIINNTIGFLGTKQHTMIDDPDSSGFLSRHRQGSVDLNRYEFSSCGYGIRSGWITIFN